MAAWRRLEPATDVGAELLRRAGHSATAVGDKVYVVGGFSHADGKTRDCSDMFVYDTTVDTWERVRRPVAHRGVRHHTAHLVGGRTLWFLGGGGEAGLGGAMTFDTVTRKWQEQTISPGGELLRRFGHASCAHPDPTQAHLILIYGGCTREDQLMSDLVMLDTAARKAWKVEALCAPEEPRNFASLAPLGPYVCLLGGRRAGGQHLVPREAALRLFCPRTSIWVDVAARALDQRSSHRAVGVGDSMYVFGGQRRNSWPTDLLRLSIESHGASGPQLRWSRVPTAWPTPAGRSAAGLVLLGGNLLLLGGYCGQQNYASDAWTASLPPTPRTAAAHPRQQAAAAPKPAPKAAPKAAAAPARKKAAPAKQPAKRKPKTAKAAEAAAEPQQPDVWQQKKRQRLAAVPDMEPSLVDCNDSPLQVQPAQHGPLPLASPRAIVAPQRETEQARDSSKDATIAELRRALQHARAQIDEAGTRDTAHANREAELQRELQAAKEQAAAAQAQARGVEAAAAQAAAAAAADERALRDQLTSERAAFDAAKALLDEELAAARAREKALEARERELATAAAHSKADAQRLRQRAEGLEAELAGQRETWAASKAAYQDGLLERERRLRQREAELEALDRRLAETTTAATTAASAAAAKLQAEAKARQAAETAKFEAEARAEQAEAQRKAAEQERTAAQLGACTAREKATEAAATARELQGQLKEAENRLADAGRAAREQEEQAASARQLAEQQLKSERQRRLALQAQCNSLADTVQRLRSPITQVQQLFGQLQEQAINPNS